MSGIKLNRRVAALRVTIAHAESHRYGLFTRDRSTQIEAKESGDCRACGLQIDAGDLIMLGRRPSPFGHNERWIHVRCPIMEAVYAFQDVDSTGRAVSHVGKQRRSVKCADCGHDVVDDLSYEELRVERTQDTDVIRYDDDLGIVTRLLCETCAKVARK